MKTTTTNIKEWKRSHYNMYQYLRKKMNLDNTYNPNYLTRTTTPGYGCSTPVEDTLIKEFGMVPILFNLMPTKFADILATKWIYVSK